METNYFGLCLAQLRRKKKLRQKQVANEAGVDSSYWAAVENGRRLPPRPRVMTKLVKAVKANDLEERELNRAAMLSQLAIELKERIDFFASAPLALTILELSAALSEGEIEALSTLVEGYRFRSYIPGRENM